MNFYNNVTKNFYNHTCETVAKQFNNLVESDS